MVEADVERFTVGVFQDLAWAQKGVDALIRGGFPVKSLTILSKDSPDVAAYIEQTLGAPAERLDLAGIGAVIARGSLVGALQGDSRRPSRRGRAGHPALVRRRKRGHRGMDGPRLTKRSLQLRPPPPGRNSLSQS
jgi:hypothetical protein